MEIRITGLDELADQLSEMEISTAREKQALNKAGDIFKQSFKENIAIRTARSQKRVKKSIKRLDGALVCRVYVDTFYYGFQEWGTSQQKVNVGRIERAIESVADEAVNVATEIMLGGKF